MLGDTELEVPMPALAHLPELSAGRKTPDQLKEERNRRDREKRARMRNAGAERELKTKQRNREARDPETGELAYSISEAANVENRRLDSDPLEDVALLPVRKMLKVQLLAGDVMLPTTPKECAEVARIWTAIAKDIVLMKRGVEVEGEEPLEDPAARAAAMLRGLGRKQRQAAREAG